MKQSKNLSKKIISLFLNSVFAFVFLVPFVSNLVKGKIGLDVAHGLTVGGAITKAFTWLITFFTFLVSHILNVAASLFDFSIKFATEYVPEKIFEQTYPVWSGIRDLGNLVIILFLGFIAISLITGFLGQATKKSVVWVLAAALLINFSGVLTLFVYNTGNALAKSFLNDIKEVKFVSSEGKKDKPCGGKVAQCIANQISITAKDESARHKEIIDKYTKSGTAEQDNLIEKRNAIQDACQKVVEDLFKNITLPATTKANLNEVNNARSELTKDKTEKYNQCVNQKIAELDDNELRLAAFNDFDKLGKENLNKAAFASSILIFMLNIMLIVAFAYAAAGLFVVGVGIVIIYIISPIGLAAYMISKTGIPTGILGNIKDEWWKNLWGFSFFTPVFFVGLWITVKLISVFKTTAENASDFSISSSAVGIILVYIMFMKSFEFAKATSGEIANGINKIKDGAQKTTKFAYNNKLTNAVKDGLGHGLNKVSGGRFATQAAIRHENKKTDFKNLVGSGFTPKNSIARLKHDIRKKEKAVMEDPTNVRKMRLSNQETLGAYKKIGREPTEELKESLALNAKKMEGIEKNKKSLKEGEQNLKDWENSNANLKTKLDEGGLKKEERAAINSKIVENDDKIEAQPSKNERLEKKIEEDTEEIKSGKIFNDSNADKHTLLQDNTSQTLHTFNEKEKKEKESNKKEKEKKTDAEKALTGYMKAYSTDDKNRGGKDKDKDRIERRNVEERRRKEAEEREERETESRNREIMELTKNETSISTSLLKGIKSLYEKGQNKITEVGSGLHQHVNETMDATGKVVKQLQEKSYNALTDMHKEGGRLAKEGIDSTKKGYGVGTKFIKDQWQNQKDKRNKPE